MGMYVGIDFGTTNSAVAIADEAGAVQLAPLEGAPYWRTVLYFEPGGRLSAGAPAIARYLETEGEGRLVQSIKSHLASSSFSTTQILGRRWALEDMIAAYLRQIRAAAPVDLGSRAWSDGRCATGAPTTPDDDARAVGRMRDALGKAGFTDVAFEYEPVGAAARYAARLDHDELIVVADFGGGTTDFSVIRVGPGTRRCSRPAASAFGRCVRRTRDRCGGRARARPRHALRADEMGGEALVPAWLYSHLRRWHLLSFLKEESTQRLLARVADRRRASRRRSRGSSRSSRTTSACRCIARSRVPRSG